MIEVQNVRKAFDGFAALDGTTLTVPTGAIYGLVGPNGAGKSTLIRHITGIYRQDEGTITVDGRPVYEDPSVKARIASIPDDWYYFLQSDVRDMMRFYRGFYPSSIWSAMKIQGGLFHQRKEHHPPPEQGHAEAGGLLAGHVHYAGLSGAG